MLGLGVYREERSEGKERKKKGEKVGLTVNGDARKNKRIIVA